ncbi:polysaccharide deacetylase family protein [Schleiferiaceae bacterium]|nr:polysaccharide deacetylase family protein [Schleiferiaceae bacterium]
MKKIVLIWDFDGFIGAVNSTYPYNYDHTWHNRELEWIDKALTFMKSRDIVSTFAITGFTGEAGLTPYTCPSIIDNISGLGHEIASHSWKHEWIPKFKEDQIRKSIKRSKLILESVTANRQDLVGFVPPHNRPYTWYRRCAFSFGDLDRFPLLPILDIGKLIKLLKGAGYKWLRISYRPLWRKLLGLASIQRVYTFNGLLILQNHHNGFDREYLDYILNSDNEFYVVSCHPIMLSREGSVESWENFKYFVDTLLDIGDCQFIRPSDLIK